MGKLPVFTWAELVTLTAESNSKLEEEEDNNFRVVPLCIHFQSQIRVFDFT